MALPASLSNQNNFSMNPQLNPTEPTWWDSFRNFFLGTPEGHQLFQKFTPEQQSVFSQLLESGLGNLQNPTQGFEPIAQQSINRFKTDIVPSILQRFSYQGSNRNSSGLQGALGSAGKELEQGLAAQGAQYGLENQKNALAQLGVGLTPQFDSSYKERKPGALETIGKSLLKSYFL